MKTVKLLALIFALTCLFCSCSSKKQEKTEDTGEQGRVLVTKADYIGALCGYFECGNTYYSIKEEYYEEIDKNTGACHNSEYLSDIVVTMEEDGASFEIIFYRDNSPRITMYCSSAGVLTDVEGNVFKPITRKDFDAAKALFDGSNADGSVDDWNSDDVYVDEDSGLYDESDF